MALNPQRQRMPLLDSSKIALLKYTIDHKGPVHNYNQKSIFWDREHVYNENLMLKTKLKQLEEINTKTKTRLLRSEREAAEMINASKGKNQQMYRSMSMQHFKEEKKLTVMKWRIDSLKDEEQSKRILLMKQKIRQLKEQIEKLKTQNVELKKTMKYTRMSQLQAENKELLEEITRMQKAVSDNYNMREEMLSIFAKEKEEFRLTMRKEIETRSLLAKELKEVKNNYKQAKNKNRWMSEVKRLESQNSKLKEELKTGTLSLGPIVHDRNDSITKLEYSASVLNDFGTANLIQNNSSPPPKEKKREQLTSLELLPLKNNSEQFITPIKPSVNVIVPDDFEPLHQVEIIREKTPENDKPKERRFSGKKEEKDKPNQQIEGKVEEKEGTNVSEAKEDKSKPEKLIQERDIKEVEPLITKEESLAGGIAASKDIKKKNHNQPMEEIYQDEYQEQEYEDLMKQEIEEG